METLANNKFLHSTAPNPSHRCASCFVSVASLKRCSICKKVQYCSADCQKRNWPVHKADCSSLKGVPDDSPKAIELHNIIQSRAFNDYINTFPGHEPLKMLVSYNAQFSHLYREAYAPNIKSAKDALRTTINVFIGHQPPYFLDNVKTISQVEEVTPDAWQGTVIADLPLRSFVKTSPKATGGIVCDDRFLSDMDQIINSLLQAIALTIQQEKPPITALLLLPYLPDTHWFQKLGTLRCPIVYFKDPVPLDATLYFSVDIDKYKGEKKEASVPLAGYCPYPMCMVYLGPKTFPWVDPPRGTVFDVKDTFLYAYASNKAKQMDDLRNKEKNQNKKGDEDDLDDVDINNNNNNNNNNGKQNEEEELTNRIVDLDVNNDEIL